MQVRRIALARGEAGTNATIRWMRRLARDAAWRPEVRSQALKIVRGIPGRDADMQASAIRTWLAGVTVFTRDPDQNELLYTPVRLLHILRTSDEPLYIDCDDVAVLAAALGKAVGLRARFVVVGFISPRAPFRHVWTELAGPHARAAWREMDVTRSVQALPSAISRVRYVPV